MTGPDAHRIAPDGARVPPLVVLGCRPLWSPDGRLEGALGRRVETARERLAGRAGWVLVSGGRTWNGVVEADAMADALVANGVARSRIVRERCSLTTGGNARFSAQILRRFDVRALTLVTCEWHLPRAAQYFREAGFSVDGLAAGGPEVTHTARLLRRVHEWGSYRLHVARERLG